MCLSIFYKRRHIYEAHVLFLSAFQLDDLLFLFIQFALCTSVRLYHVKYGDKNDEKTKNSLEQKIEYYCRRCVLQEKLF